MRRPWAAFFVLVLVLVIVIETPQPPVAVVPQEALMSHGFDHEKLHVYRAALEFVAWVTAEVRHLDGIHRHARDQIIRSSNSVVQNIAEGNGKRSPADRRRFFEIARGSALESAGTLDVLVAMGAKTVEQVSPGKEILERVVSMLTKMTVPAAVLGAAPGVRPGAPHAPDYDYEHEHEHE